MVVDMPRGGFYVTLTFGDTSTPQTASWLPQLIFLHCFAKYRN